MSEYILDVSPLLDRFGFLFLLGGFLRSLPAVYVFFCLSSWVYAFFISFSILASEMFQIESSKSWGLVEDKDWCRVRL